MKRGKRIMVRLFSLVIGFSMLVPNNVFAITNEDNHVETVQTNLANDQLAKQNESGIHDIFYPKDNSKLELFKARVLNRLLYKDEEIDVSDIDISPYEIQYTYGNSYLNGEYAARQIVRDNVLHSTVSTIGFPIFTYKDNGNVATVKYTYHPAWTDDFIKRVIAGYDEAISLINPNDTDFAKALKLHDWIVKNVSYGMSKTYSDFAVGALANRSAVCAGYAQCYQFLLSQVGVQSIYIAAKTTKEPHAWNLVKIDGHYFHVDCTWDRGLGVNPNVNHTYFMLNDEEFNADGAHTEDWKDPSKGYPTNNQCSIENKFYKDYKVMATDEQIAANPIKIKHVYDDSTTYNTSSSEHWRTCVAGVEVHEKHDGNPCSVCHYETVKVCDHTWINNHDDSNHWEECSKCKEIRNKEKHTPNGTWEKDDNSHWVTCTKCSDVKLNKTNHTWSEEYDATYHWKQCSICGYETTKVKHNGNPCSECNYESSHVWKENHNDTKHWQECSICNTKQNEENHTAKAGWLNDSNNHWQVCSKCSDVKMNNASHTWIHKHDEKSHWNECSICGYETTKAKHDGNPCSECKYESKHIWADKHDDSKHWQECSICHTKQNEENHKTKVGWLNDSNNHWQVCSKCLDVKMNIQAHTFVQKNDGTYHWEQCSTCGYEINRVNIEISVTDILLNTTSKTIQKGKTYTLVPTIAPTNATNKKLTYSSNNKNVATVTSNGTIKAINGGTAVITVKTSNGKKATCKVTVPYTVKYNLNGGTNNKSNPISYYGKKITLQNPTKKGYVFAGWYSDSKYKTKVTSFTSGNKTFYAKWSKVTVSKAKTPTLTNIATRKMKVSYGATSGVKGYQIQYATNSKFTGSKTKTTTARSYTLTSLTKGKRYYVRVRGYKTDSTENKVYGSWSAVKSIKIGK